MGTDKEIRRIAYQLWQDEGCPDGRNVEHWLKAEAIFRKQEGGRFSSLAPASPKTEQPRRRGKRVLRLM
jgi:hypothetical protein